MMIAYLGETQNGNLPAVCSIKTAINLSREPRIALWTITGLLNPGLSSLSSQTKSSLSYLSGPNSYLISSFFSTTLSLFFPASSCSLAAPSA